MTYEEALNYIHSVKWQNSKPGLSRTQELLSCLGNPEKSLAFIHVAGTNGKGSTSAMLASVLQAAGYRVGLYTSPYIYVFNERMQINGENIPDEELAELTEEIRPYADAMEDAPTEFEMITALAMLYFYRHACDIVVLEAGMGGELDSTNVIPVPEAAVLTAIGLDHTAFLGNTIAEIAGTKAGIIKEGGNVVIYGKNPEAEAVFEEVCRERNAALIQPDWASLQPKSRDLSGQVFDYGPYRNLRISLLGLYQTENAAVALTVIQLLNQKGPWVIPEEAIRRGLQNTRWGGRLDVIHRDPLVIVDGSHNPQGIEATVNSLREYLPREKFVFLMSVSSDKDVRRELAALAPLAEEFVAVAHANVGRTMSAEQLAELVHESGDCPVCAAGSLSEGCALALEKAGGQRPVCAIGSLYAVGDITREMKRLLGEE